MKLAIIGALACAMATPSLAQEKTDEPDPMNVLAFLVGEWEGRSTFLYPSEEGREPSHENGRTVCVYILNQAYIQCDTAWTNDEGRTRNYRVHYNFNELDEIYQKLYIYDNWPRHVLSVMNYDKSDETFSSIESDFENSAGQAGRERGDWRVSNEGRLIKGAEYYHFTGEADGVWHKNFEYEWRKVE